MENITRQTIHVTDVGGNSNETESESKSSVEIGESAKGEFSIKSIKVYHASVEEAGILAIAEYRRIKKEMGA